MQEFVAEKALRVAEEMLEKMGFNMSFICGAYIEEGNRGLISFPFIVKMEENLLVNFLYHFLNEEQNTQVKEKLLNMFNPVDCELKEFIKTVNL